ncbi:MAG: 4Fe-4S binding protein [Myxococcaceae bacterium]
MTGACIPLARPRRLWPAAYVLVFFLAVGLIVWALDGSVGPAAFFGLVGLATAGGFLIHARVKWRHKTRGHKVSLAVIGLGLFLGAGVFGRQSFQLEGFFFYLLNGVMGGVVIHYLVAKILGPLFIGRAYCGWGCWTWMVLEYLPFKKSHHRPLGRLPWLRLAHFFASAALVFGLWFLAGYRHGTEWSTTDGLWWFLGGNALYFGAGVVLAFVSQDNRAFCKILCPVTVFLRVGARRSLLKIAGDPERCTQRGACDKSCPMDVPVMSFIRSSKRVLSPECVLCQTCVAGCPERALDLSLGLD